VFGGIQKNSWMCVHLFQAPPLVRDELFEKIRNVVHDLHPTST